MCKNNFMGYFEGTWVVEIFLSIGIEIKFNNKLLDTLSPWLRKSTYYEDIFKIFSIII